MSLLARIDTYISIFLERQDFYKLFLLRLQYQIQSAEVMPFGLALKPNPRSWTVDLELDTMIQFNRSAQFFIFSLSLRKMNQEAHSIVILRGNN